MRVRRIGGFQILLIQNYMGGGEISSWKDLIERMRIAEAICKISLSHKRVTDAVVWLHNKDGNYSVRSGYRVAKKVLKKEEWVECSTVSG